MKHTNKLNKIYWIVTFISSSFMCLGNSELKKFEEIAYEIRKNMDKINNYTCHVESKSELNNNYLEDKFKSISKTLSNFVPIKKDPNSDTTCRYQSEIYFVENNGRKRHDVESGTLSNGKLVDDSRDVLTSIWDNKKSINFQDNITGKSATISQEMLPYFKSVDIFRYFGQDFIEFIEKYSDNNDTNLAIRKSKDHTEVVFSRGDIKYKAQFDDNSNYNLISLDKFYFDKLIISKKYDYRKINDIWFPSNLKILKYSKRDPNTIVIVKNVSITKIQLNKEKFADLIFDFEIPQDTLVDDRIANIMFRVGEPIQFQSFNDELNRVETYTINLLSDIGYNGNDINNYNSQKYYLDSFKISKTEKKPYIFNLANKQLLKYLLWEDSLEKDFSKVQDIPCIAWNGKALIVSENFKIILMNQFAYSKKLKTAKEISFGKGYKLPIHVLFIKMNSLNSKNTESTSLPTSENCKVTPDNKKNTYAITILEISDKNIVFECNKVN